MALEHYNSSRGNCSNFRTSINHGWVCFWDIQIQPIVFKYAYLKDGEIAFTNNNQMKIRDKYIKIRVRYDGTQYAIINALKTFFTLSFA